MKRFIGQVFKHFIAQAICSRCCAFVSFMAHFSTDNEKQEFKLVFCGEVDKLTSCASEHKFWNDVLEPGGWVLLTEWNY